LLLPRAARACATCTCGDPTLTVMGAQQPFAQRLRLSLSVQHRTDALGREGIDRVELQEQQLLASVAYAPAQWLMLSATLPLVRRELTYVNLARDTFVSPGDVELRGRAFIYRDRSFAPRHLLALVGGLRVPTGPLERDSAGDYAEPELQPGTGSFDPLGGVSYAFFADPWSAYASEIVYVPTPSRAGFQVGASWRGSHTVQYQLGTAWAVRLGANFRLEDKTRREVAGQTRDEPDSGGFVLFATPSLVFSPMTDLILNLNVNVPVYNRLLGAHDEGPIVMLGAAYDV
jgi:hypothetical protein